MNLFSPQGNRFWFHLGLAVLAISTVLVLLPSEFGSQAVSTKSPATPGANPYHVTKSDTAGLENYDIRLDKSSALKIANFRQSANRGVSDLAFTQQQMLNGAADLRQRVTSLVVEYSPDLGAPEVIGTDVLQRNFLTAPNGIGTNQKHAEMVKAFLGENNGLIGLDRGQISELKVVADYTNPDGNLSYVDLGQEFNGIPVFRGEVRAMITRDGAIARLINNLAPGLENSSLSTERGRPEDAVFAAARFINHIPTAADVQVTAQKQNGNVIEFAKGQFSDPSTAELMYFPLEPGVARLAWRVYLWEPVAAYYVVVDAQTGELLWRKNTTNDQTQSASYTIYPSDNPGPLSPTTAIPGSGLQGTGVSRSTVSVISELPAFDNLGWITDGNNTTDGNNVQAGLDRDGVDGVDAAVTGAPNRTFNFTYNPPPLGADAPLVVDYQNGIATNLFFWTNRYHDIMYTYGFTEAARNFQNDNFGRGGVAADRVRAESQDSSGTNNANFSTPADGGRGRMQMYIFTGPNPDRDGDIDQEISIHEMTHGLSNRLIGNATGLTGNRGGSMGEGWSDFYGRMILSTADEDVNATYAMGAYATLNFSTLGTNNYYYGIRRFPYAVKTTLGTNGNPHNPLTLADIDPAQINTSDGAFGIAPWITNTATEVHNAGEVWCMMLLEVRARIITRMGYAAGNARMMQITTDGLKLTPTSPNFIQARDAILAADVAGFGGADTADIWNGFATRGAGFGAKDGLAANAVIQSFSMPNAVVGNVTFTDAGGNNNGIAEPGENLVLTVPLSTLSTNPISNVNATIAGNEQNYGTIGGLATVNRNFNYTVPAATACGARLTIPVDITSSAGAYTPTFVLSVGQPAYGTSESFDGLTAPALPAGWTTAVTGSGVAWVSSTATPDTAPNAIFTSSPETSSGSDVTTTDFAVPSAAAKLTFRINYQTEGTYDGALLEISIAGGAFQDIVTAGGSFITGGYVSTLDNNMSTNPLAGRLAWNGNSGGYITVLANLPAGAAGQNVKFKFRNGTDTGTAGPGVNIDGIRIINTYNCSAVVTNFKVRADFDGDGKSDVSVVRGGGTWYLNRSTAGFAAINFGTSGDVAAPGDYDGDGKTDEAVVRSGNQWYLLRSTAGFTGVTFGASGDLPMAADYDGDGKTDVAVFRPSTNAWYALRSSDGSLYSIIWGQAGDVPVVADFDGDGKADPTVFRPGIGTWFTLKSTGGMNTVNWGLSGDVIAPADYDGDGKVDYAVFRTGNWYILKSGGGTTSVGWGTTGDVPVPGDYDGDGKYDVAVFRTGAWYVLQSSGGSSSQGFGLAGDVAVPVRYIQ
ncbi:MAG: M36 family metallopeptidase [Pyrinomonadaceae bacterium]